LIRRPLKAWLHVRRFMKWWSCSLSCRWKGWPQTTHWRGGGTVRGLARRLARRFSSERQAAPHVFRWRYRAVGSVAPRVNVEWQMVQVFGGRVRRRGGMASGSPASRARRRRRRGRGSGGSRRRPRGRARRARRGGRRAGRRSWRITMSGEQFVALALELYPAVEQLLGEGR